MTLVDLRPASLDFRFRPGDAYDVRLNGPAGWLTLRSFTATFDGDPLTVTEDGDALVVTVAEAATDELTTAVDWVLTEVGGNDVAVGLWTPSVNARRSSTLDITLTLGTIDIDVDLSLAVLPSGVVVWPA